MIDLTKEICSSLSLQLDDVVNMHVKIHEDNVGTLILGKLEPRRMTPCSKHCAVMYHWFREQIGPRRVEIVKIATEDQLGDIFTKGLDKISFKQLQKKLMGW
jgi:hypothetical protein